MATRILAGFGDDGAGNSLVRFEYDYDANNRLTALRCLNNSGQSAYGEVVQMSNGRKYSGLFLPASTTVVPIPTAPSLGLAHTDLGNGRFDGISAALLWPYTP